MTLWQEEQMGSDRAGLDALIEEGASPELASASMGTLGGGGGGAYLAYYRATIYPEAQEKFYRDKR